MQSGDSKRVDGSLPAHTLFNPSPSDKKENKEDHRLGFISIKISPNLELTVKYVESEFPKIQVGLNKTNGGKTEQFKFAEFFVGDFRSQLALEEIFFSIQVVQGKFVYNLPRLEHALTMLESGSLSYCSWVALYLRNHLGIKKSSSPPNLTISATEKEFGQSLAKKQWEEIRKRSVFFNVLYANTGSDTDRFLRLSDQLKKDFIEPTKTAFLSRLARYDLPSETKQIIYHFFRLKTADLKGGAIIFAWSQKNVEKLRSGATSDLFLKYCRAVGIKSVLVKPHWDLSDHSWNPSEDQDLKTEGFSYSKEGGYIVSGVNGTKFTIINTGHSTGKRGEDGITGDYHRRGGPDAIPGREKIKASPQELLDYTLRKVNNKPENVAAIQLYACDPSTWVPLFSNAFKDAKIHAHKGKTRVVAFRSSPSMKEWLDGLEKYMFELFPAPYNRVLLLPPEQKLPENDPLQFSTIYFTQVNKKIIAHWYEDEKPYQKEVTSAEMQNLPEAIKFFYVKPEEKPDEIVLNDANRELFKNLRGFCQVPFPEQPPIFSNVNVEVTVMPTKLLSAALFKAKLSVVRPLVRQYWLNEIDTLIENRVEIDADLQQRIEKAICEAMVSEEEKKNDLISQITPMLEAKREGKVEHPLYKLVNSQLSQADFVLEKLFELASLVTVSSQLSITAQKPTEESPIPRPK